MCPIQSLVEKARWYDCHRHSDAQAHVNLIVYRQLLLSFFLLYIETKATDYVSSTFWLQSWMDLYPDTSPVFVLGSRRCRQQRSHIVQRSQIKGICDWKQRSQSVHTYTASSVRFALVCLATVIFLTSGRKVC